MLVINTIPIMENLKSQIVEVHGEKCRKLGEWKQNKASCIAGLIVGILLMVGGALALPYSLVVGAAAIALGGIISLFVAYAWECSNDEIKSVENVTRYLGLKDYVASAYEYKLIPSSYILNRQIFEIKTEDVLSYKVSLYGNCSYLYITTNDNKEHKIKLDEFSFAPNSDNKMRLELVDNKIVLTNI